MGEQIGCLLSLVLLTSTCTCCPTQGEMENVRREGSLSLAAAGAPVTRAMVPRSPGRVQFPVELSGSTEVDTYLGA